MAIVKSLCRTVAELLALTAFICSVMAWAVILGA